MRRVEDMRAEHPERIISISVDDEHLDGFIHVPPDAFTRLLSLGYACAVSRLVPDVTSGIGILVARRISDLTQDVA